MQISKTLYLCLLSSHAHDLAVFAPFPRIHGKLGQAVVKMALWHGSCLTGQFVDCRPQYIWPEVARVRAGGSNPAASTRPPAVSHGPQSPLGLRRGSCLDSALSGAKLLLSFPPDLQTACLLKGVYHEVRYVLQPLQFILGGGGWGGKLTCLLWGLCPFVGLMCKSRGEKGVR